MWLQAVSKNQCGQSAICISKNCDCLAKRVSVIVSGFVEQPPVASMNQIKEFLSQAAKHRFWIVIGLSILLGTLAWYMAQSQLQKLYAAQESAIKGKYSALDQVSGAASSHPNESSQAEMNRIIQSMSADVQKAWEEQYQRQADYLKWPDIGLPRLIAKMEKYYPVEMKLTFPEEPRELSEAEKESFRSYFDRQMPELAKVIGVQWGQESAQSGSPSGVGAGLSFGSRASEDGTLPGTGGSGSSSSKDIVRWPVASQTELLGSIRMWPANAKPTMYEILYTQENIWILQSLFNIIARTNIVPKTGRPAAANVQASVKEIEFIRIGKSAIGNAGDIVMLQSTNSGAMDADAGSGSTGLDGMDDMARNGDDGSGGSFSGLADAAGDLTAGDPSAEGGGPPARDPANRRYVDRDFSPITGEDLRTKITSEEPEDAYFAVAKRVPVRMRLSVDPLRIPVFLANCGNEGMMLEVRQVRIGDTNPASATGGSGGGYSSMSSGGGPMFGGRGGEEVAMEAAPDAGGSGFGNSSSSWTPGGQGSIRSAKEIKLEVYGIVYLFYPVNIDRLGLNKVDGDTEVSETVQSATEVAAPEAEATTEPVPATLVPEPDATAQPAENGDAPAATQQPEAVQPTPQ